MVTDKLPGRGTSVGRGAPSQSGVPANRSRGRKCPMRGLWYGSLMTGWRICNTKTKFKKKHYTLKVKK